MNRLLRLHYGENLGRRREKRSPSPARRALEAYLHGELTAIDGLATATGGTLFQREVWSALRQIPAGQTLSYGELARRIGRPQAVRAVGLANGANPVGIVVPCHRVVRTDGSLSGYRWGVERKRLLLEREQGARLAPAPPQKSKLKSMSSGTGTS